MNDTTTIEIYTYYNLLSLHDELPNVNVGGAVLVHNLVWQELGVALDVVVVEAAADEALDVEYRVRRVRHTLVLRGLTNQALSVSERHPDRKSTRLNYSH